MPSPTQPTGLKSTRRSFLRSSARTIAAAGTIAAVAAPTSRASAVHVAGNETLRIALVGCGSRGAGAVHQALSTAGPTKLVAMADLFPERLESSLKALQDLPGIASRIDVPRTRQFTGFEAYVPAIEEADVVVLATPPHYRPIHYAAVAKAGRHVFMEKPCCVDAPGYRQLLAANEVARAKHLSVGVGLQRRHMPHYQERIRQIRNGAVGDPIYIRTYFNIAGDGPDYRRCPPEMTEMEWQCRRWQEYTWLCGDFLVEQTCHSIDVANWIMDAHPVAAYGLGGRHVRIGPANGDQFDHHHIEFVYQNGVRYACQGRQIAGAWSEVSETVHGTKGELLVGSGLLGTGPRPARRPASTGAGKNAARPARPVNAYQQEHDDLFASIRGGKYLFAGDYAASSSMTAVMGRMASYSGKKMTWEMATTSDVSLAPERYAFDASPPIAPGPDGEYPIAMPGRTRTW